MSGRFLFLKICPLFYQFLSFASRRRLSIFIFYIIFFVLAGIKEYRIKRLFIKNLHKNFKGISSMSTSNQNGPPPLGAWSLFASYMVPVLSAGVAIVPAFRDMAAKSELQRGQSVSRITLLQGIRDGVKAAPTVGIMVGTQMVLKDIFETAFVGKENKGSLSSMLISSAVVGAASAPVLAVFNGRTMGWGIKKSLKCFSAKQCLAITLQETAFVFGLGAADRVAILMKARFGDNKPGVEYVAAFTAGALGSLAGHPANTALTRWQSGLAVDHPRQLMWGSLRKARAVGVFAVVFKLGKETLNPLVENSKEENSK